MTQNIFSYLFITFKNVKPILYSQTIQIWSVDHSLLTLGLECILINMFISEGKIYIYNY